ncbi:MAG: VanZ family protein [Desulfobulbaceae bacterium]|nr:VanZ family protein [Desulfobulbaceae bacterium]
MKTLGTALFSSRSVNSLFFLLFIITLITSFSVERYEKVGRQLLRNNDFTHGFDEWKVHSPGVGEITIKPGGITLHSKDATLSQQVSQRLLGLTPGSKLLLQATIGTKDIIEGVKSWNRGRVVLIQYVDNKAQYNIPHALAALGGMNRLNRYSSVFLVAPFTTEVKVAVQMSRCAGALEVGDLALHIVTERAIYVWAKRFLLMGWGGFIILLLVSFLKRRGALSFKIMLIGMVTVIVAGTSVSGKTKNVGKEMVLEVIHYLESLMGVTFLPELFDITKVAHFGLFALLVLGMRLLEPTICTARILLGVCMVAVASECIQFFVDGRSPLIADVLIDLAGGCSVLLILYFWKRCKGMRLKGIEKS